MSIPKRSEIKPVILAVLADGNEHSSPEIQEVAAKHFRLTAVDLAERRGHHLAFENEHAFALNLLVQDRWIELVDPGRRIYKTTRRGMETARSNRFEICSNR